jgi:2-polyprenyl-3-methyl-5-hydroxy-6-metoxy-1,4-benzoquinol methylase
MENINNSYFDGHYKDIWRSIIPLELTVKETDFILQYFNLQQGDKVLDLMCGYGRHAIALAKKGLEVTAVDNLNDYIEEIEEIVKKDGISIKAVKTDVINYKGDEIYDLVICMGNSLNFFDSEDTIKLLSSICSQIKRNGHLLINTWSLAEIALLQFKEKSWNSVDSFKHLADAKYLFHPTRIETETTIILPDGSNESKKAIDYIFSIAEMEAMLNKTGFSIEKIYSIPGRKEFKIGDPRAYIIAKKTT